MSSGISIPAKYLVPLNVNGLRGRLLRLPPPQNSKKELLLVYGHHSSLERIYNLAQVINDYSGVTVPDLPGFGGMDNFYKVKEKPDLDTMADYLASIVKLRFRNRRLSIAGLSYGFLVVTRMLQRYPELVPKVETLVSVAGFTHYEDLIFSKLRLNLYRTGAWFFKFRFTAAIFRNIFLHPFVLRNFYSRTFNAKKKFADMSDEERSKLTEFEVRLWRINDASTHMFTSLEMLTVNNCVSQVKLPVWHVGVKADNYFNNNIIEQHMRVIFTDYTVFWAPLRQHMPNLIAPKSEVAKLLPDELLRRLGS